MNTSLIKSALAMTAAFAVGSALATETVTQLYGATFEQSASQSVPLNDQPYMPGSITNCHNNGAGWYAGSADDQSEIILGGTTNGTQALKLQTEGGTLTNVFNQTVKDAINDARTNATGSATSVVRFEASVKFVASDTLDCGVEAGGDAKFALYAYAPDSGNTTNLVIFHKYWDDDAGDYLPTNQEVNVAIDTEAYTDIVVDYYTGPRRSYFSVKAGDSQAINGLSDEPDDIWFVTVNGTDAITQVPISSLCFKGTGMVDDIAISKVEEAQQSGWVADPETITAGTSAATQYSELASSALATADAKELTVWAAANNVDFSAVTAAPADYVDAFLLNCTVAEVDEKKEDFILEITIENGVPKVKVSDDFEYNGKLQLKGATSLTGDWSNIEEASNAYNFYKYELSL